MREATVCLVRLETILLIVSNWEKFSVWLKRRTQQLNLPFDQSVIRQKPMRRLIVQKQLIFMAKLCAAAIRTIFPCLKPKNCTLGLIFCCSSMKFTEIYFIKFRNNEFWSFGTPMPRASFKINNFIFKLNQKSEKNRIWNAHEILSERRLFAAFLLLFCFY